MDKCRYCQLNHYISSPRVGGEVVFEIDPDVSCIYFRIFNRRIEEDGTLSMGIRIKYCPMCGRKLTDVE